MTLTIAISAKNAKGIIEDCFKSIKAQSIPPEDVILVVDDNEDNTIPVAAEYNIRVALNEGKKLYHARNTALKNCHTDILAFTDSDCVLDKDWVKRIKEIMEKKPEVAAGTGAHPMIGKHNFSSWLHHMWFIVETRKTGYSNGVIGGNAYFRTDILRQIGGWLKIDLMAAEDVYISKKILQAGHKIWFDDKVIAHHHYKAEIFGFFRQAQMMGRDIVIMMRAASIYDTMWYYTMAIPAIAAAMILSLILIIIGNKLGVIIASFLFLITFFYLFKQFKSFKVTLSRWIARWIIIWPYSLGVIKGIICK